MDNIKDFKLLRDILRIVMLDNIRTRSKINKRDVISNNSGI